MEQAELEQAKGAAAGMGAQGFVEASFTGSTRSLASNSAAPALFKAPIVEEMHPVQNAEMNQAVAGQAIDATWFAPEEARRPVGYASWVRRRPRHIVPRFVREAIASALEYVRDVGRSFIRDCSYFFRPNFRPIYSQQQPALAEAGKQQATPQRSLILPVANWLRQPMKVGRVRQRTNRIAQGPVK